MWGSGSIPHLKLLLVCSQPHWHVTWPLMWKSHIPCSYSNQSLIKSPNLQLPRTQGETHDSHLAACTCAHTGGFGHRELISGFSSSLLIQFDLVQLALNKHMTSRRWPVWLASTCSGCDSCQMLVLDSSSFLGVIFVNINKVCSKL